MRSSPNRICGFMAPADATTSPVVRSQTCAAIVVEPTSTAAPYTRSRRPGHTAMMSRSAWTAAVMPQSPSRSAAWRIPSTSRPQRRVVQPPLRTQGGLHPAQVARGVVHVGLRNLDVAQSDERVDANRVHLRTLADDLPMHLAVRRNVDDDVAPNLRRTPEAPPRAERCALLVVALLDRPELGEMLRPRAHAVLGEHADALHNLAATADTSAATHRIEVDAERPGRFEDRRPRRKLTPPARWREHDPCRTGYRFLSHAGDGDLLRAGPARLPFRAAAARGTSRSSAGSPDRVPS